MEIAGEDSFRIRSYRNGATAVEGHPERVSDILRDPERKVTDIAGIGKELAFVPQGPFSANWTLGDVSRCHLLPRERRSELCSTRTATVSFMSSIVATGSYFWRSSSSGILLGRAGLTRMGGRSNSRIRILTFI